MNLFKNITTRQKHWIFFVLTAVGSIVVVNLAIFLLYYDLNESEREFGQQIFWKVVVYGTLAMAIVFFVSSQFILYIFNNYISPLEVLTEETRLISVANDKYRIKKTGALEAAKLTEAINDLADSYIELKSEVKNIVSISQHGFDSEKRRLETLMAQLDQGVIVCNLDGRIMTFNDHAMKIFEYQHEQQDKLEAINFLGKGRSIFGVLNRKPIVYAVNYLQSHMDEDGVMPVFKYVSTRNRTQFLKIAVAPILSYVENDFNMDGFVITLSDITQEIKEKSKRDVFLQSLTIGLQTQLDNISYNLEELKKIDSIKTSNPNINSINESLTTLIQQIDDVSIQHSGRLKEEGNTEFILSDEFLDIIKENIVAQFSLEVIIENIDNLWLTIESYSITRGIMYLLGQLTKQISISKVILKIVEKNNVVYLEVSWDGELISITTLEEWKQCPLLIRASKLTSSSFDSMIVGENDNENDIKDVRSVMFRLIAQEAKLLPFVGDGKESRPLYHDLQHFDKSHEHNNFDNIPLEELTFVVFDTETTGLNPSEGDEIISIAGVRIYDNKIQSTETFDQLVNPQRNIPMISLKIHEISPQMLKSMPTIEEVLPAFHKFAENAVLVAHNAAFDMRFLQLKEEQTGIRFNNPVLDTLLLSVVCHPKQELHNLEDIAEKCGVDVIGRHTALGDSYVTAEVLLKLIPILKAQGITTLKEAKKACMKTRYSNLKF